MTPTSARRLRLRAQALERPLADPAAAVRRMLAVQAQDVVAPLAAIATRVQGHPSRALVEQYFVDGALVRSWTMRGTLHVVAAEDLGWLLGLTRDRTIAASRTVRHAIGVTDAVIDRAIEVVARIPVAGLRRPDLLALLAESGVDVSGNRGYHVLMMLAVRELLCIGSRDGTQYRFHRCVDRLPASQALERDEALGRLAVRYLDGHGPATDADLAWWSALTLTDARRGLAVAADVLERVELDGRAHWILPGATAPTSATGVIALPAFDEWYIGYADRTLPLGDLSLQSLVPTSNGRFLPVVTIDGRIVATWDARGGVHPLVDLTSRQLELIGAAAVAAAGWG